MDTAHQFTTIYCQNCGHSHDVPVRCGRRFCRVCSACQSARARKRISFICKNIKKAPGESWKFITLTVRSHTDLSPMLDRLVNSFRRLRSRHVWHDNIRGGLYVLEVTHSAAGWHAHLHILCIGRYVPQHHLSRVWKAITGSPVVDIRQVKSAGAISYVTKYMTTWDLLDADLCEAEAAVKNRRMWSPFGIAHDLNLQYKPEPTRCPDCGGVCWISQRSLDRGFARACPDG